MGTEVQFPTTIEGWEARYRDINAGLVAPEDYKEAVNAKRWQYEGMLIDEKGELVRETVLPEPVTQEVPEEVHEQPPAVENKSTPPRIDTSMLLKEVVEAVPVQVDESQPQFLEGSALFHGEFAHFYNAYWGKNETCAPYLMAGALTQVAQMLGRRACVSRGPILTRSNNVWPNLYNVIIGPTSIARKSSWLGEMRYRIREIDPETNFLESVASAEGLTEGLSEEEDIVEFQQEPAPEGKRTLLMFDEMKVLFTNSRRNVTSNIIPHLTTLYQLPPEVAVNSRNNAVTAYYPVLSILAASTGEWLEDSVTRGDVKGGFINRCSFWLYELTEAKPQPEDPDVKALKKWQMALAKCQAHGRTMRAFSLDDNAWEIYKEMYINHRLDQWENRENYETEASSRSMDFAFKVAMAFAAVTNKENDNKIHTKEWLAGCAVAKYVTDVNKYLFSKIGAGESSRDEETFLNRLKKLGNKASRTALRQEIGGKYMSRERFNQVLQTLENSGMVAVSKEGRTQIITRVEH